SGWVSRVTISRVTKTQVVDVKGRRWLRRNGAIVGGTEWDRRHIVPWTEDHDRRMTEQRQINAAVKALDALAKARHEAMTGFSPPLLRALPHLLAAVAAITEE